MNDSFTTDDEDDMPEVCPVPLCHIHLDDDGTCPKHGHYQQRIQNQQPETSDELHPDHAN